MLHIALAICAALAAQNWEEIRYDRVHLRNGNFIDGKVLRNEKDFILMKLKVGRVTLKREQIDRVEVVKLRSLKEESKTLEAPKNGADPTRRDPFDRPKTKEPKDTPKKPEEASVKPVTPEGSVQSKIDGILKELAGSPPDRKAAIAARLLDTGPGTAAYLASILESLDGGTLGYAANALMRLKDPASAPVLVKLLKSPKASVRAEAVGILKEFPEAEAEASIRKLLNDEDPAVRTKAVTTIQQLGDNGSFSAVAALCKDADAGVRRNAIKALVSLANKHDRKDDLKDVMTDALESTQGDAKADILGVVVEAGGSDLASVVLPLLSDDSPKVRAQAAVAAGKMRSAEMMEAVLTRIGEETEYWPRVQLAQSAEKLRMTNAIGPLIEWLQDSDKSIRSAASTALRGITGQKNFGSSHEKWSEWWERVRPKEQE